ncbi:MAG: Asp-tRNA(Asn)/Glu-tRNA(Gln) amidotransferase subunit GatB, partial [candidate division Zixibacteria bacterium]
MEKGHLRCDANISVRPIGEETFGTRTEIKNMNSFKGVERAIKFEIQRQVKLLKSGSSVTQATLLWDESRQVAEAMRSKEESHDYRYFPEPDLVNLVVNDDWIENVKENMPELPDEKSERFVKDYQIRPYDAMVLTDTVSLADYYDEVMQYTKDGRAAANWVQSELLGVLKDSGDHLSTFKVRPNMIADIVNKIESKEISGKMAKQVFAEMVESGKGAEAIIKEKGLVQISDEKQLLAIIGKILSANSGSVDKYKSGKTNIFGFFVGQVMKETKGQANPEVVNRLLKQKLDG